MTTTNALRARIVSSISSHRETVKMGAVYAHHEQYAKEMEALLAEFDRVNPDVDAILAMDKVAIRSVPEETFQVVKRALWQTGFGDARAVVFSHEVSRRKAAATKAKNAANKVSGTVVYADGEACQVHAFGHWYNGTVVRTTRTGSVVVRYTSGTGVTREKTVGADLIRKAQ